MNPAGVVSNQTRDRAKRLFEFIKRFEERRSPPRRDLEGAAWRLWVPDLPEHPNVQVGSGDDSSGGEVLAVTQPQLTSCPPPPAHISEWLISGWKEPTGEVQHAESRTRQQMYPSGGRSSQDEATQVIERFDADPARVAAFEKWKTTRAVWADAEKPARLVAALFQDILALWARLQREGEALRVYLGDAFFIWQRAGDAGGAAAHPLILLELELRYEEDSRKLLFTEVGRAPILYSQLFSHYEELAGDKRRLCRDIVEKSGRTGGCHPLAEQTTDAVVQQLGAVLDIREYARPGKSLVRPSTVRVLQRRPVLFAVPPVSGLQSACDGFIEGLPSMERLPAAVARIVDDGASAGVEVRGHSEPRDSPRTDAIDLYLTKPANAAQEEIARRLRPGGTVLVQGPPGTGKTHTIANILGHLLAEGKRVLVTAQTTKALRVLREKVAPPLQPLCVSVLDSDLQSRAELEHAVNGIASKLTTDVTAFDRYSRGLDLERRTLINNLSARRRDLRTAISSEYEPIVVAGDSTAPSDAARRLAVCDEQVLWIPPPLTRGAPSPLDDSEVAELYRINHDLARADELIVQRGLPDPHRIMTAARFSELVEDLLRPPPPPPVVRLWEPGTPAAASEYLEQLAVTIQDAIGSLPREPWLLACVQAGMLGGPQREPWAALIDFLDSAAAELPALKTLAAENSVELGSLSDWDAALAICEEIVDHVTAGGKLGWLNLVGKGSWKSLRDTTRVRGKVPASEVDFIAIRSALRLAQLRVLIQRKWDAVAGTAGLRLPPESASVPEEFVFAVLPDVRRALGWSTSRFGRVAEALDASAIRWRELRDETSMLPPHAEIRRLLECVGNRILPSIHSVAESIRRAEGEALLEAGLSSLRAFPELPAARLGLLALQERDPAAYARAVNELWRLWNLRDAVARRSALLGKVVPTAPAWAALIEARAPGHRGPTPPGPFGGAWLVRQWTEELDRRATLDAHELQKEVEQLETQLRDVTSRLVENLAWAAQVRRTNPAQHRALMSWLDLVRRIGKGTGMRADELKRDAQRQLETARDAVPVWIMPLSRVAESFVPGKSEFDVVILDEASQCDLRAIVAMSLGRSVVVVGDDEQVSPLDVGHAIGELTALQDEYLSDFRARALYDGRASAYEIARSSFPGGLVRLVEHFRCVPDIIAFSSALSYKGEIKPLREASDARVHPAVIAHRVLDGERVASGKTNRAESLEVASLIVAASELSAYDGLTMGVISLLSDPQARDIDLLLQRYLPPAEYKRRRIICGNASHFQGDERDVMFLSMVYSGADAGPLRMTDTDEYKRRYNVAASRARDQMWIVHSLDVERDLKAGDLRRRLLEHAADPKSTRHAEAHARTESDFERRVLSMLLDRGFRVRTQVEVGAYRLDMVVEGTKGRIAIECDGDRYHPLEKLDQDLARQAILERLGWRFIRIRGTAFYRRPDAEITRVSQRLNDLGIDRIGTIVPTASSHDASHAEAVIALAAEVRRRWIEEVEHVDDIFDAVRPTSVRARRRAG